MTGRLPITILVALAVSASMGLAPTLAAGVTVELTRDAKPVATIVTAKAPTRAAQFAAAELQHHIELISGARPPVVTDEAPVPGTRILVGESAATRALKLESADFKPQEYLISLRPGTIILIGCDKDDRRPLSYADAATFPDIYDAQATCYAVYDFLERYCGVRWYLPVELGTIYDATPNLRVSGRDLRRAPAWKTRNQSTGYQFPADLCGDTIKGPTPTPVLPWREQLLFWHRMRLGGEAYQLNHSLYGYYDRFLKEHPDWFAQGYQGKPPQLCYTNPGTVKQVIQDANDYFAGQGAKSGAQAAGNFFAIVPMDNNSYCQCPTCKPLVPAEATRGKGQFSSDRASEYLFGFVNQVARAVHQTHPDKWIAAAAYFDYAYPPRKEKLEANVTIQMCLHARMVYATKVQANDRAILDAWVADSPERAKYVYLYYCFPSLSAVGQQFRCFPGFFAHSLIKELATYHRAGVRGIYYEPSYLAYERRSAVLDQVECYLTWKLVDDPTLDGQKLYEEFFTRYYQAAAVPMRQLYEAIEETYSNPANYGAGPQGHQTEAIAWGELGTAERMRQFGRLMRQARRLATGDLEKQRVALFEKGIYQYMVAGRQAWEQARAGRASSMQTGQAPHLAEAVPDGNPRKVNWAAAGVLGNWRTLRGDATPRRVEARVAHDGKYLYLKLEELTDTSKLAIEDDNIWHEDEWEVFFSRQRARPYRQIGVNVRGVHQDLEHDAGMVKWDSGSQVFSDATAPDRWVVHISVPLDKLLPGGAKPGETIYMNVFRATHMQNTLGWVPTYGGFHEPTRMGQVVLGK